ncbi:MAG: tRNA (guanosine(37)-N1)-methyltransferase TrmD [Opitutae bacterium]|jgi:tRNA (guanine37-N1)-methyltransferase|nr:tRNA (guanosine(37)-N1)-methyltransferase TrmD [Opitutae bacterium]MBT5378648.1 tRNA (guanosine(37)-N1)-methyltransferase TrmD [Opitutae bacterium]MBT5691470.1 tRNA (guanosine(37)-N1)-methyltransferase TrmD [Opitutae bacterium]MBT6957587.1 tRNA (guanosine(37)-N1)-methyltransferase TrmD [Opitutae bacterium]MBT7851886.1 tRNA (guanosine(37)-N1)-methyltransferase TrmD [Opitutae bacterium]
MQSKLKFDVITLFPGLLDGVVEESIIGRAVRNNRIEVGVHDLREWAEGPQSLTDDRPFGGGAGMVLKPEPLFESIESLATKESTVVYMSPDGENLSTPLAQELAEEKHLVVVSGHYEGIDQRVRDSKVDREVSIGDYVLTNGTLAAAVLIDAVSRFVPGVLGKEESLEQDAFADSLLSHPQYTRPAEYRGIKVPDILLSGHHKSISNWRQTHREEKTRDRRPDLLVT